ncbi:ketopantoate reductase family protein [Cellulomonas hominis]
MRYVIIGAGAVGGTIGGLLAAQGRDVALVARGAHLAALRSTGLEVTTATATRTVHPPAVAGPDEVTLTPDDVLVLAVKSQDTAGALADWSVRPVTGGGTAGERLLLVCAQNGVDNERSALRWFARVAGMCVWLPATFLEPGRVSAPGAPVTGILTLGTVPVVTGVAGPAGPAGATRPTGPTAVDPQLATFAADLEAAGFRAPVVPDVMPWKYAKLLSNLANAVEALCGSTAGDDARALIAESVAEARRVLDAAGVTVLDEPTESAARAGFHLAEVPGAPRGGGSTWQSLVRGTGSIEAAYLNGEIVLLGRLHGVPTPVSSTLQRLAGRAAAEGTGPGTWSAADVRAEVRRSAQAVGAV